MRTLTPSNVNHPDQKNPTVEQQIPLIKPEVIMVSNPDIGTTKIFIHDLPRPHPELRLNRPNSCNISRIVHQYKHLITEGDRLGSKEYRRKLNEHLPLENAHFRAKVSHTITYDAQSTRLEISFIQCYTTPATLRINGTSHCLSDSEITDFIKEFCAMCASDLQLYLNTVYLDAIYSHRTPDYYSLTDPTV